MSNSHQVLAYKLNFVLWNQVECLPENVVESPHGLTMIFAAASRLH